MNANGFIDSQDLFDFLTDFFALRGDANCDHVNNSQDFFDFISCLLTACD